MPTTVPTGSDAWLAFESPEFALRFGRLLTTTRRHAKRSVDELAAASVASGFGFDASQLRTFEQGSATVDESIVDALCLVYSADVGRILPVRLPVVIAGGRISGAGISVAFSSDDPTSLMTAYLRLIQRMRNQKKAPAIALRRDDILTVARYLDIDGADVVERLSTLMSLTAVQRRTMSMLFATGAIVIGLAAGGHVAADAGSASADTTAVSTTDTGTGTSTSTSGDAGLVAIETQPDSVDEGEPVVSTAATTVAPPAALVTTPDVSDVVVAVAAPAPAPETTITNAEAAPAPSTEPVPAATALTASAAIVESAPVGGLDRAAEVVGPATATRLQVPAATPPLAVASEGPTPNQSGCNPDPSDAVMNVVIPDIAYSCPVYAGGQSMIDAGFVTLVTDAGANPVLATRPGQPGTLWLAGHRSTNGSAFANVPDLADGALVTVSSGDATATYRVVGRSYVEVRDGRVVDDSGQTTLEATWRSIIRDDFSGNLAPRLVLQTCEGVDFRWMIYADLVTG